MLILTRKKDEAIVIGEGSQCATVRILNVDGNQISIGVDAPRHVSVHREEVYRRIQEGEPPRAAKAPLARSGATASKTAS